MTLSPLSRLAGTFALLVAGCGRIPDPAATSVRLVPDFPSEPPRGVAADTAPVGEKTAPADWRVYRIRDESIGSDVSLELPAPPARIERWVGVPRVTAKCELIEYSLSIHTLPILSADVQVATSADRDRLADLIAESALAPAMELATTRVGIAACETERCFCDGMRTIRRALSAFEPDRYVYWQYSYDRRAGRMFVLAAASRRPTVQDSALRVFNSFRVNEPDATTQTVTCGKYSGEFAADPAAANRRYDNAVVEITGRVSDIRVQKGPFGARHRFVALSGGRDGSADSSPDVLCSMNGTPWRQLSPGCVATVRGRNIGLARGTLVNCDVLEAEGPPCSAIASEALAEEFAADRAAAGRKYVGRMLVVSGRVVKCPSSELPRRHVGLFLRGRGDQAVFCALSPAADVGVNEYTVDEQTAFLARYSADPKGDEPIVLSECFPIELLEPPAEP